jgi:hypothetical protein
MSSNISPTSASFARSLVGWRIFRASPYLYICISVGPSLIICLHSIHVALHGELFQLFGFSVTQVLAWPQHSYSVTSGLVSRTSDCSASARVPSVSVSQCAIGDRFVTWSRRVALKTLTGPPGSLGPSPGNVVLKLGSRDLVPPGHFPLRVVSPIEPSPLPLIVQV